MESKIEYINYALKKNETIVFTAECEVKYSGRAEAFLPVGDRLIIIKNDKTLLVHQPQGNNPINYMRANSHHTIIKDEGKIILKSQNLENKDFMEIILNKIYFVNSQDLKDGQKVQLTGSEKDMSDMIYENPEIIEPGFRGVSREEQTKYGFIDVLGIDKDNNLTVVECKRYKADLGAVQQLRRYVEKIEETKGIKGVKGIVAAPQITDNAKKMLEDWGFKFVMVSAPRYQEKFNKSQMSLSSFNAFE